MPESRNTLRRAGFVAGLLGFLLLVVLPTFPAFVAAARESTQTAGGGADAAMVAASMQNVCALLFLMVTWWITEAVPLPATALAPAVLLPLLRVTGLSGAVPYEFTFRTTLGNYASPVIYLFLGGFLLAAALQKWGVDRRVTLWLLTRGELANSTRSVLLAMMGVTAFLSMWISNTATAAMMLPLGLGILALMGMEPGRSRFGTILMLGIAWSASIGGVGTVIGTPPNGIALGILHSSLPEGAARITFLDWMSFGVPFVLLMVPLAWVILVLRAPPEVASLPGGKERLAAERAALGTPQRGELLAIGVFLLAVLLWVSNPFWSSLLPSGVVSRLAWVDEYTIGLLAGVLCFLVPVEPKAGRFLLGWKDTKSVDWGTLVLFGGGIALSDAMFRTGVASWIATSFVGWFGSPSPFVLLLVVVLLVDFLTEVASNTAVTGMIVPVVMSIALRAGESPVGIAVAAAVAASMAFMLPVATPPNALVYGTGYIRMRDMIRYGFILDVVGWLVTVGVLYVFGDVVFGVIAF